MIANLEREIEAAVESRVGRECVFVPSGRLASYLAFRLLLSPGDRMLMSPLEDDTVFFAALAAGVRPVMAPVSAIDGSIRVDAVPDETWVGVRAVLTSNIYGLPDDVRAVRSLCDRLGIPLIEDVAHAIETDVEGRPVGAFGAVSFFSLSKHFPGRGGVLSFDGHISRTDIVSLRDEVMEGRPTKVRLTDLMRSTARTAVDGVGLRARLERSRHRRHPVTPGAWRTPLDASQLQVAISHASLQDVDDWMRIGYPDYRMSQPSRGLQRALDGLRKLDGDRRARMDGVRRLERLDSVAPGAIEGEPQPLLRVPLLVEDRDTLAKDLHRHGVKIYFIYDPPLDDYAGADFADPSANPEGARWWARHVLPINPLDAERVLSFVDREAVTISAARPPI